MASTEVCLPAGPLVWVSAQRDQANQGAQMTGPAASRLVVFGIDPHKATHTVVAVDEVGRQVDQRTVAARTPQHLELLGWAARLLSLEKWFGGKSRPEASVRQAIPRSRRMWIFLGSNDR